MSAPNQLEPEIITTLAGRHARIRINFIGLRVRRLDGLTYVATLEFERMRMIEIEKKIFQTHAPALRSLINVVICDCVHYVSLLLVSVG